MNPRTVRILIGILLLLGFWVLLVERPFTDDIRGPSSKKGRVFRDFDPDRATAIEIHASGRATRLEKEGGTWLVAGPTRFRADAKAVSDLLAKVDTMEVGTVASTNPAKQATFGVDSSGVRVTIQADAAVLADFRVGNSTPDFSGLFFRAEGNDDVISVPDVTRFMFDRGEQTWRDKKMMPFTAEEIRRISLAWQDTTVTLNRDGTDSLKTATWTVAGNRPGQLIAPARADQARNMAQGFGNLMADGFPAATDTIPAVWEPLTYRFDIEATNGDHAVIEVGPKLARGQHVVRRVGEPAVVLIGPWRFTRFKKSWDELRDPAAASAAPVDTTGALEH